MYSDICRYLADTKYTETYPSIDRLPWHNPFGFMHGHNKAPQWSSSNFHRTFGLFLFVWLRQMNWGHSLIKWLSTVGKLAHPDSNPRCLRTFEGDVSTSASFWIWANGGSQWPTLYTWCANSNHDQGHNHALFAISTHPLGWFLSVELLRSHALFAMSVSTLHTLWCVPDHARLQWICLNSKDNHVWNLLSGYNYCW
jgi:hypothetical protein